MKQKLKSRTESKESVFNVNVVDTKVIEESQEFILVEAEFVFYRTVKGDRVVSSDNSLEKFVNELKGGFYQEDFKGSIKTDIQEADLYKNKTVSKIVEVELIKPSQTDGIQLTNALGEFKGKIGSNSVNLSLEATLSNGDNGTNFSAYGKNFIETTNSSANNSVSNSIFDSDSYSATTPSFSEKKGPSAFRGDGSHVAITKSEGGSGSLSYGIQVQKQSDGTQLLASSSGGQAVQEFNYSSDGKYLIAVGGINSFQNNDFSTVVFDAENNYNKVAEIYDGNDTRAGDMSKNNEYLAVGQSNSEVLIVDTSDWSITKRLVTSTSIEEVRFSQDGDLYASNGAIFDVDNNFSKTTYSFSGNHALWIGGQYLVKNSGASIEIRDKNNSYNVVTSSSVPEDFVEEISASPDGTRIVVAEYSTAKGGDTGNAEVYATGFDPGPNLGSVVQIDSSGVKQTNASGVVLTQE